MFRKFVFFQSQHIYLNKTCVQYFWIFFCYGQHMCVWNFFNIFPQLSRILLEKFAKNPWFTLIFKKKKKTSTKFFFKILIEANKNYVLWFVSKKNMTKSYQPILKCAQRAPVNSNNFPIFSGKNVVLASMRALLILVGKTRHSGVNNVHNSL